MTVKTAHRTLDVVELFASERRPLNLSDMAARLSMPPSSTHALINTLLERGYLYETGKRQGYYPTRKLKTLSDAIAAAAPLLGQVGARLDALCAVTGETVLLAKRQGDAVAYLEVRESAQSVRFSPLIGELKSLHSTASGKALLGALPRAEFEALLKRLKLERRTENTITDAQKLAADIAKGRRRGWYHIVGENIADLMSISAPVDIDGETYVITVGGPTPRFKPLMARHAEHLLACCATLMEINKAGA